MTQINEKLEGVQLEMMVVVGEGGVVVGDHMSCIASVLQAQPVALANLKAIDPEL